VNASTTTDITRDADLCRVYRMRAFLSRCGPWSDGYTYRAELAGLPACACISSSECAAVEQLEKKVAVLLNHRHADGRVLFPADIHISRPKWNEERYIIVKTDIPVAEIQP
jgi:hypothetical protein